MIFLTNSTIHWIVVFYVRPFSNFVSFKTTLFVEPLLICVFKKFSSMFDTFTFKRLKCILTAFSTPSIDFENLYSVNSNTCLCISADFKAKLKRLKESFSHMN